MAKYFSEDYLNFFKELAPNNHKDWFDENRQRYHQSVKEPFEQFVTDLIGEVQKRDASIQLTYNDSIFRINRDIRFSKNKEPYKLNRSAIISAKGRKDKAFPGLYIEMGPEHYRVYGGVYQPSKDQLYDIRESIAKQPSKFMNLVNDKKFKEIYGEVRGDKNKVLPKEFKDPAAKTPLIFNKQFYWFTEFEPEIVETDDLMPVTLKAYEAGKPLMDYFIKAML
ncbi:MAG: DUF2461 domain-containing protein [Crocinitomicaceae bacterium]